MGCYYLFVGSNLEKYGKFWKNGRFSGRLRPDWGNTARADMAGLGSKGLSIIACHYISKFVPPLSVVSIVLFITITIYIVSLIPNVKLVCV